MKFLVKAFQDKFLGEEYRFGIFVPAEIIGEIVAKDLNAALYGENADNKFIDIPYSTFEEIVRAKISYEESLENEKIIGEHRIKGIELEKTGNTTEAVKEYAEAIHYGLQSSHNYLSYAYAVKRIIILLGKLKQYNEAVEYIDVGLSQSKNLKEIEELENRKRKYISKISDEI